MSGRERLDRQRAKINEFAVATADELYGKSPLTTLQEGIDKSHGGSSTTRVVVKGDGQRSRPDNVASRAGIWLAAGPQTGGVYGYVNVRARCRLGVRLRSKC